jgi:hypothetical protein
MTLIERIESQLAVLRGLPLWDCGRAADLQWLAFGKRRIIPTRNGGTRKVGEYALHIQCAWRVRGRQGIRVASRDRYYPKGDADQIPANFKWDEPGANRCDERMAIFVKKHCPAVVESIVADDVGGLQLFLEGGLVFEVFPDNSTEQEHWRLFRPGSKAFHIVFAGGRLDKQ